MFWYRSLMKIPLESDSSEEGVDVNLLPRNTQCGYMRAIGSD